MTPDLDAEQARVQFMERNVERATRRHTLRFIATIFVVFPLIGVGLNIFEPFALESRWQFGLICAIAFVSGLSTLRFAWTITGREEERAERDLAEARQRYNRQRETKNRGF